MEKNKKITAIFVLAIIIFAIALNSCRQNKSGSENKQNKEAVNEDIGDIHNSQNSLDWEGIYFGIIPAASAEGIRVKFEIKYDETFKLSYQYIGKSSTVFETTGTFKWSKDGGTIILDNEVLPRFYKVGENCIWQLDMQGKDIEGELADKYILRKRQLRVN
jgi:uncharacterized lipoprotein NlpE involved in copper resistance